MIWKIPNPKIAFCPLCDAVFWTDRPVCDFCARMILQEVKNTLLVTDREQDMSILSLFRWGHQSPRLVSDVIYLLKGGRHPEFALWLARLFLLKNKPLIRVKARVLIPAPAKTHGPDHASVWATALLQQGSRMGFYWSPLESGGGHQKRKSRFQRRLKQTSLGAARIRRERMLLEGREMVFCDDVVASGGTAGAAYKALGKPKSWTIWALAYRLKESACQEG